MAAPCTKTREREVVGSRLLALWIKSKAMLMIHVRGSTVYKNEGAEHEKIGPLFVLLV